MIPVTIEVLASDGTTEETIELTGTDLPAPPLEVGGKQRIKKTVYPRGNANTPRVTFQVLGPEEDDVTLQGVWKDRRGGDGHAAEMTAALDGIRYSGKPVRVSWDTVSLEGIIAEFKPSIRTSHDVRWSLTLMVGESAFAKIQTAALLDHSAEVEAGIQAALAEMRGLEDFIDESGELFELGGLLQAFVDTVTAISEAVGAAIQILQDVVAIVQQVVNLAAAVIGIVNKVRAAIAKVLTQLTRIRNQVGNLFNSAWQATTTSPLAVHSAVHFVRECSRIERATRVRAMALKVILDGLASPTPQRVHTVGNNDTLFSIARQYYRDALAWRRIAEANGLKGADLADKKTLVIP